MLCRPGELHGQKGAQESDGQEIEEGERQPGARPPSAAHKSARGKTRRAKTRRSKPPTKVASAFQLMIDTINETERLRAKNERRDVTDETG